MLISHRHQFIYTKTAKTAGTSVEAYFERFCMPEGEWSPAHARAEYEGEAGVIGYRGRDADRYKWYNHMPAARIREQLGEERWQRYFKFCVVRNPWEKAISAFAHFGKAHQLPGGLGGALWRWRFPSHNREQLRFLHWLRKAGPPNDRDKYLIGGQVCVDEFIRYEALKEGMKAVCEKIGLSWDESQLPNYKAGVRKPEDLAGNLYLAPAREFVARFYAFEIGRFGYRFPGGGGAG